MGDVTFSSNHFEGPSRQPYMDGDSKLSVSNKTTGRIRDLVMTLR